MQFVRPFKTKDLPLFERIKALGFDFIELLMPEPEDDLELGDVRKVLADYDLSVVLAARVNAERSIVSADPSERQGGIDYLKRCIEAAALIGATIVGGPLYGGPLVFAGVRPMPINESERQARFNRCVAGLAEAADLANKSNVRPPWNRSIASKPTSSQQSPRASRSSTKSAVQHSVYCSTAFT